MLGDIAFGDREKARETRFRRQQVVKRGIHPAGSVRACETVADRENASPPVVQEAESHVGGDRRRASRQRGEIRAGVDSRRIQGRETAEDGVAPETDLVEKPGGRLTIRGCEGRFAELVGEPEQRIGAIT